MIRTDFTTVHQNSLRNVEYPGPAVNHRQGLVM